MSFYYLYFALPPFTTSSRKYMSEQEATALDDSLSFRCYALLVYTEDIHFYCKSV